VTPSPRVSSKATRGASSTWTIRPPAAIAWPAGFSRSPPRQLRRLANTGSAVDVLVVAYAEPLALGAIAAHAIAASIVTS
jgi:hypothetical protein